MNPLIDAKDLQEHYYDDHFILIDASSSTSAKEDYNEAHLDKVQYVNLNTELSDIKVNAANGGRHPLPSIKKFAELLEKLSIDKESHIVIFDDKNGANAATRFWWMLKAAGHKKVQILNGGKHAFEKLSLHRINASSKPKRVDKYTISNWQLPLSNLKEVEKFSEHKDYLVVDVRETQRFKGEYEPIDLIAGHIPGAINIPFSTNLNEDGNFLPPNLLKEKYEKAFQNIKPENIIIHCGSGVTACHTIFSIAYAGLVIPKLYIGSWSEWSRNDKPICKGI